VVQEPATDRDETTAVDAEPRGLGNEIAGLTSIQRRLPEIAQEIRDDGVDVNAFFSSHTRLG
jgi:hypothetical protein